MTNAERIRRGLPLAKPVDKRTFGLGHGHGPQPPKGGPSCVPKTVKVEETKTITKSVTPTKYVTTTKCGYTQTVHSTSYVTSVKTETQTKNAGHPTTVFTTVTPHQSMLSPCRVRRLLTIQPKRSTSLPLYVTGSRTLCSPFSVDYITSFTSWTLLVTFSNIVMHT